MRLSILLLTLALAGAPALQAKDPPSPSEPLEERGFSGPALELPAIQGETYISWYSRRYQNSQKTGKAFKVSTLWPSDVDRALSWRFEFPRLVRAVRPGTQLVLLLEIPRTRAVLRTLRAHHRRGNTVLDGTRFVRKEFPFIHSTRIDNGFLAHWAAQAQVGDYYSFTGTFHSRWIFFGKTLENLRWFLAEALKSQSLPLHKRAFYIVLDQFPTESIRKDEPTLALLRRLYDEDVPVVALNYPGVRISRTTEISIGMSSASGSLDHLADPPADDSKPAATSQEIKLLFDQGHKAAAVRAILNSRGKRAVLPDLIQQEILHKHLYGKKR